MKWHLLANHSLKQQQTNTIIFITFWSQFASYALNTILILFLTRPILIQGLGYDHAKAYAFIGVTQATGYLMPALGGFMADKVLGVRRAILIGSLLLSFAYLLIMLSGYTIHTIGDRLFLAAYALIPACNSLLMGTASTMVSYIHADNAIKAKAAMTYYYMAINIGGLLAAFIAPSLLDSPYGPLSVLTLTFIGKSIAALNFAARYSIYEPILWGKDTQPLSKNNIVYLIAYLISIYSFTLLAYSHVRHAIFVLTAGCLMGILWFVIKTTLLKGDARFKQLVALILTLEAIVFFITYNQMNSTLVLLAQENSNHHLLGFTVSPAQYQMLNPLLILLIGSQLPRFYQFVPRFTIPYQFASGTLLASLGLLTMAFATQHASSGLVEGNYIALTYILISIAELWVSAIGLSMIGLYCDTSNLAFAMGVWYVASALSHAISGQLACFVAIPETVHSASERLVYYKDYYFTLGIGAFVLGLIMWVIACSLHRRAQKRAINLV